MWPGFGENKRVLEWVFKRTDNEPNTAQNSPIGLLPAADSFDLNGLNLDFKLEEMLNIDKKFWIEEAEEIKTYFEEYVNESTPVEINNQIKQLVERVKAMK